MNYRVSESVCLEMIASLGKTLEVIRDFNGRRNQFNLKANDPLEGHGVLCRVPLEAVVRQPLSLPKDKEIGYAGSKSKTRMVATVFPLLAFASTMPTLHVQMSPFFAVHVFSS